MSYLKNIATGAVSGNLSDDSDIYSALSAVRDATTGKPAYEAVSQPQAAAASSRFVAATLPAAGALIDKQVLVTTGLGSNVTVSTVTYTPVATITGQATNYRTISVVADPDAASPVSVASLAFSSGAVTAPAGTATTITAGTSAVPGGAPLVAKSVHTGTGIADPGGLLVVSYS